MINFFHSIRPSNFLFSEDFFGNTHSEDTCNFFLGALRNEECMENSK